MTKSIRIISPAGALDSSFITGATDRLCAAGFGVDIAPHAIGSWGRFAARPEERIADAVDSLTDPHVGLVLCTRGGYGLQQIIDGIAAYVTIPDDGTGLDVGCGSGALTIACAKRTPNAQMIGCDIWSGAYKAVFTKDRCEENADAECVENAHFEEGNAIKLPFADECFDAVTSNYVYHNIAGKNKQELLLETLRVLKKGGTFAIHDLMSKARYGDMEAFVSRLKSMGYEDVRLIDTTVGNFMTRREAALLGLSGSTLLVGKK